MYLGMYFFTNCKPFVIRHNTTCYYICIYVSPYLYVVCAFSPCLLLCCMSSSFTIPFFNTEILCPIPNLSFLNCTAIALDIREVRVTIMYL